MFWEIQHYREDWWIGAMEEWKDGRMGIGGKEKLNKGMQEGKTAG